MFEQSILATRKTPWTMAVSLTVQCALVSAVVLLSILRIDPLGPISLPDPVPPFPRFAPIKVVATQTMSNSRPGLSVVQPRVFVAPTRIPAGVNTSPEPAFEMAQTSSSVGVVGSGPGGVAFSGLTNAIPVPPPPSRTDPVVQKPAAPLRVGGAVLAAQIVDRMMPVYPPLAKAARIQGRVQLAGVIARDGTVKDLRVISGHPLLVASALEAVRHWRYKPTLLNGEPVEVAAPIDVNFTLSK